jgi:crotonyl-CoA carboxylase/reductase
VTPIVPIGELPELGHIPDRMHAQVIRSNRLGDPRTAFQHEHIDTPRPRAGQVLVAVMAAGLNYNNVWAARGEPVDVIAERQRRGDPHDFHIGGSDASGIVWAVGDGVTSVAVGDHVIVHPGSWDVSDPFIAAGGDPMLSSTAKIWGYNTNFGSFAQFAIADEHQVLPKSPHLTWEAAAAPTLVGTTAYRMLFGWPGNELRAGDCVLVWGGSGGLGVQAIQLAARHGARAVAVVSSDDRGEFCQRFGACGYINRSDYAHWGPAPRWDDTAGQRAWTAEARRFREQVAEISGVKRGPAIVFEHPGEATVATSVFTCAPGGMVVICGGTSGYWATVDIRYLWVMQKRFQGSHGTNDAQAVAYNDLVIAGAIDPGLGEVMSFDEIGRGHYEIGAGIDVFGNRAALVGASTTGLGAGA